MDNNIIILILTSPDQGFAGVECVVDTADDNLSSHVDIVTADRLSYRDELQSYQLSRSPPLVFSIHPVDINTQSKIDKCNMNKIGMYQVLI